MNHKYRRFALLGLAVLLINSVAFALAAANTVPASRLDNLQLSITADSLKPSACAAITVTTILVCPAAGGRCDGTDASDLIVGSAMNDDIWANKGDDCILGGGGDDTLRGEQNTDVCIGGPGADSFHPTCETSIQ